MEWTAPGPGCWTNDRSHQDRPFTRFALTMLPGVMIRAMGAGLARIGVVDGGMTAGLVNGWNYAQDGPLDPSTFADRELTAVDFIVHRRWEEQLETWRTVGRPTLQETGRRLQAVDLASLTDRELLDHLDAVVGFVRTGAEWHFEQHGLCALIGEFVLSCREWGVDDGAALALLLGASPASVETTAHLTAIARALGDVGVRPRSLDEIRAAGPDAAAALDEYLAAHGCQPVARFDLDCETLAEMPDVVLSSVLRALDSSPGSPVPVPDPEPVRSRIPAECRTRFDDLLAAARAVYGLRDDDVAFMLGGRGLVRRTLLEISRRLVAAGRLHAAGDVFELSRPEVPTLLLDGTGPTADEVRARVEARDVAARSSPPPVLGDATETMDLSALPATTRRLTEAYRTYMALRRSDRSSSRLSGVGIGTAPYRGRAVVAPFAEDAFARLEPGDVLVAVMTTPAFNGVLAVCGALVVEAAGILSHAAVMARELGLPAVLGVSGATVLIPDGVEVEVDPVVGVVRVLT